MRRFTVAVAFLLAVLAIPSTASARHHRHRGSSSGDYADTALNVIPSGQQGHPADPARSRHQAKMYDALTPLFDQVTPPT